MSEGYTTVEEQAERLRERAQMAHASGQIAQAIELYQEALEKRHPGQQSLSDAINLGALLRRQGKSTTAEEHYRKWLPRLPQTPTFSLNASNCLRELGKPGEALYVVDRCLEVHPNDVNLLIGKAECYLDLGNSEKSKALLEKVLLKNPCQRQAWIILGVVLASKGQLEAALHAFERADQLEIDQGQMAANRINIMKDIGRLEEAVQLWNSLSAEKKATTALQGALGGLLIAKNKPGEASNIYAELCRKKPAEASHWLNWAACLRSLKYTVAPAKILKRGLLYQPKQWELQEALTQAIAEMGCIASTRRLWQLYGKKNMGNWKDIHLMNRQFLGISDKLLSSEQLANLARDWESSKSAEGLGTLWRDYLMEPIGCRKLRVGYLTADTCNHPVGRFLLPILKSHNAEKIETWILNCGSHNDWITEQLRLAAKYWMNLNAANDLQAARLIADLRLDVIVELGGFTGGSRIGALVHKPAPVQLSYLGYPAPTYLRCIDGWIGDDTLFADLNDIDKNAHKLISLAGGYMAFDAGAEIDLPSREGSNIFRFGCFNHARKLSDFTIKLFVKVMESTKESELILKSISFHEKTERERIRDRFERAGLDPKRLTLLEWVEGGLNHLMRYSTIDVALDPIPYGGATTTCEALWMGVPVVTLAGAGMVGRLSASILEATGHTEWIAKSEAEYVKIARSIQQKGLRQHSQRMALRKRVSTSSLCNARRLANELEKCYLNERARIWGP